MKVSPGKAASITSLVLLLLFPNVLVLLGYTVNESIFLGIIAALSGGLIAAWSDMEEEQKPPQAENIIDENKTKSQPDKTSNNQELNAAKKAEISPKETPNPSQQIKGRESDKKSPEKTGEEQKNSEDSKNSKNPVSNRRQRKGVSLLSWLLMKKQESSKKPRS